MLHPTSNSTINLAQPLNRSHWLAQGLQFFGKALPGLMGGAIYANLCDLPGSLSQGRHGTLTGMPGGSGWSGQSGPDVSGWHAASRSAGAGEVQFHSSSTPYITIADTPSLKLVNSFTLAFWNYQPSSTSGCILSKFSSGAGSSGSGLRGIRMQTLLYVTEQGANPLSAPVPYGAWFHVVVVSRHSGSLLYLNAVQVSSGSALSQWFNNGGPIRVGAAEAAFFSSTASACPMFLDDLMCWNIPLSASAVQELFVESQLRFPGLLMRTSGWGIAQQQSALYYNWRRRAA